MLSEETVAASGAGLNPTDRRYGTNALIPYPLPPNSLYPPWASQPIATLRPAQRHRHGTGSEAVLCGLTSVLYASTPLLPHLHTPLSCNAPLC